MLGVFRGDRLVPNSRCALSVLAGLRSIESNQRPATVNQRSSSLTIKSADI